MIFIIILVAALIALNIKGIIEARKPFGGFMDWMGYGVLSSLGVILIWALIAIPVQDCITTYETPEVVTEQEIVSLSNDLGIDGHGGRYYVSVNSDNIYSYRVEVESEVTPGETTYELLTVGDDGRVLEVETTDGSIPKMIKYIEKGKVSFWSMGLDRETYVFYIPEGSICKDVALK